MKLRNLLIASMGLLLFGACSSSDEPEEIANKSFETYLSISGVPNLTTKADPTTDAGTTQEQFVKTLTAYVFDAAGNYVTQKTATSDGTTSLDGVEYILVKVNAKDKGYQSTDVFQVFLLANATLPSKPTVTTLKDLVLSGNITTCTVKGVNDKTQFIPMFSSVISGISGLVAGTEYNNWTLKSTPANVQSTKYDTEYPLSSKSTSAIAGEPATGATAYTVDNSDKIPMNRYVARVEMASIKTAFTENYKEAKFILDKISMANVSGTSLAYGTADFSLMPAAPTYYRGYPETIVRKDYILADGTYDAATFMQTVAGDETARTIANNSTVTFSPTLGVKTGYTYDASKFYVFEHSTTTPFVSSTPANANNVYTMLLITGRIVNNGITNPETTYRVIINDGTVEGVKHNYIYKLNVTLTGTGSQNPDENMLNAYLSLKIEVEPWTVVNQTETDVN